MTVSLTHSTPADGTFSATGATAWDAQHVLTQDTARLLGRTTAGVGATEEISVGTGLSLSGGTLTNTVTATAPGGSNTQIQFNNAGAFGGASGLTTNGTELTIASGTKTASAPVLDMSQTWNNSGVTFTGLKFNATDTASAAASLLMDLQVGGTSRFSVRKDGYTVINAALINVGSKVGLGIGAGSAAFLQVVSDQGLVWSSTTSVSNGVDLLLTRRAAANLRFGAADAAAPVAQTLSVQSVVAGTTNTAGANLTITGSQGTGTGAGGSIIFQVAPAGSTGTAQNALATALTIAGNRNVTFTGSGHNFNIDCSGIQQALFGGVFGLTVYAGDNILAVQSSGGFGFTNNNSGNISNNIDVYLRRDAANTLALRNGTNAQTFNVYNTFTSSTNFERFRIVAQSAAAVLIGTEKGSGGGTARALEFQTDGTTRLAIDTAGRITISNGVIGNAASGNGAIIKFGTTAPIPVVSFRNAGDTGGAEVNAERVTIAASSYVYWNGRSSIYSPADGNLQLTNLAANGFGRLQFGGTTSSFPALKRSSASLIVRLADDTANAALESASLKTDAPAGGTAGTWKLGVRVAATTILDTTQYIEVDVGGTLYKLAVVTS